MALVQLSFNVSMPGNFAVDICHNYIGMYNQCCINSLENTMVKVEAENIFNKTISQITSNACGKRNTKNNLNVVYNCRLLKVCLHVCLCACVANKTITQSQNSFHNMVHNILFV